jgi:hypothetical protein
MFDVDEFDYDKRVAMFKKEDPRIEKLEKILLSHGGERLALGGGVNFIEVHLKGKLFKPKKKKFKKMEEGACHDNAINLCLKNESYRIGTGWALSEDGIWRQHSWVFDGENIIETTVKRKKYFGVIIDDVVDFENLWE